MPDKPLTLEDQVKALEKEASKHRQAAVAMRKAETALLESEKRFRQMFMNTPMPYQSLDENGNFIDVNQALLDVLGYGRSEVIGRHFGDFLAPEWMDHFKENFPRFKAVGEVMGVEFEMVKKDGKRILVTFHGKIQRDEQGGFQRTHCIFQDISQLRHAEEELKNRNQVIEKVLDNLPIGFAVNRISDSNVIYLNKKFEEIYGWPGETIQNVDDFFEKVYPGQARLKEQVVADITSGDPARMQWTNLRATGKDGSQKIISASNIPLMDQDLMISTVQDITGPMLAEQEKKKLQDQLLQAQKMESVGRLAGGLAHDLNNMLGVILGHSEMAMELLDRFHPVYTDLDEIFKAAGRSADLTRQLLAFARKQTVTPRVVDLNSILAPMINMLQNLLGENIRLVLESKDPLWKIRIDPVQISQILVNLAMNARDAIADIGKFTLETANAVLDETYCCQHAGFVPGEYVLMAVSDDGCGMDRATAGLVFEPFYTTKKVGKGTGLGLAAVYGIVKQNKGFIYMYSEPGRGTTFKLYFPRYEDKIARTTKKNQGEAASGSPETVLLVEDEPAILKMVKMMLQRQGHAVLATQFPEEAISIAEARKGEIRLLITDVVMPKMSGPDLAKRLLAVYPDLTCLFMSGYTANVIADRGLLDESENYIQKPFSSKDLAAKIRDAIRGD